MGLSRGWGSAGSVLRSQGSSREHGLSRCARGMRVIASYARSGPIPLPPVRAWWVAICRSFGIGRFGLRFVDGWRFLGAGCVAGLAMVAGSRVGAPRDRSCARRERGDRRSFRAIALTGSGCGRSNARSGPIPLPPVRAWWVAICRSFGIGRLGLRFVAGWRFLGAGPAGEALSRAPQIEFGRSTT
jgi:hypothetical protein